MDASTLILAATTVCAVAWAIDKAAARSARPLGPAMNNPPPARHWIGARACLASAFLPMLAVLVLRIAVAEPFRIPSGSMMPGLLAGDFIAVDKSVWGVRLPWSHELLLPARRDPRRGDIAVFRYPRDTSVDYVKRLVGLPGDRVRYDGKRLSINGQPAQYAELPLFPDPDRGGGMAALSERLPGEDAPHAIALEPGPGSFPPAPELAGACSPGKPAGSFDCVVPPGSYLAMGDNRDHSADSRFWGFVPRANLVGRAFHIWFSLRGLGRVGPIS